MVITVFIWEDGNLREVFVDEYRNYSLIDEESYLSGDLYNTYGCYIDGDALMMRGARLVLDEEGNVIGVDSEMRKYHYTNGYFCTTEDGLY